MYCRKSKAFAQSKPGVVILLFQEIELKVPMCCSKCEGKMRETLRKLEGKVIIYRAV